MTLGSHQSTIGKSQVHITPGVFVRPRPEYESLGQVPTGKVLSVVPFGKHGSVYVEGEPRAFVAECFEIVEPSHAP